MLPLRELCGCHLSPARRRRLNRGSLAKCNVPEGLDCHRRTKGAFCGTGMTRRAVLRFKAQEKAKRWRFLRNEILCQGHSGPLRYEANGAGRLKKRTQRPNLSDASRPVGHPDRWKRVAPERQRRRPKDCRFSIVKQLVANASNTFAAKRGWRVPRILFFEGRSWKTPTNSAAVLV